MSYWRLTTSAELDLHGIWMHIAADRLVEHLIRRTFPLLAANPLMGERRDDLFERCRLFVIKKHVVAYRPTDFGVEIARVLSGYRDFESILRGES